MIPLDKDEYDVFGDGTAIIKAAPGHTPGHQVLVLNLASTGKVMIAGDLYHYPPEREVPPGAARQRVQRAAVRRLARENRGLPQGHESRDLDRARVGGEREAEEVSAVR